MAARDRQARRRSFRAFGRRGSRLVLSSSLRGAQRRSSRGTSRKNPGSLRSQRRNRKSRDLKIIPLRPVIGEDAEEDVVLPLPIDAEIFAGVAFFGESRLQEQSAARQIMRQAGRLDAVQAQPLESEAQGQRQAFAHIALARMRLADPIADAGAFGDAAADIGEADPAEKRIVLEAEEQEGVAL